MAETEQYELEWIMKFLKYPEAKREMSGTGAELTWVPNEEDMNGGFVIGEVVDDDKKMATVRRKDGVEWKVESSLLANYRANPAKFNGVADMAELSFLNEPSVLHNLDLRYQENIIYTYSGLFLVVVNPYKQLPIYMPKMVQYYKGLKRGQAPPHVFVLTDNAYRDMLAGMKNQSILITGESGSGKTENTKKVIQYLTAIACKKGGVHERLEQQLLQANPILESFGNAKTLKNNNSSRFGKFIEIHFDPSGFICGGTILNYLLEKSRVVYQAKGERDFHVFYQMLEGATKEEKKEWKLLDPSEYHFLNQSACYTVVGFDDKKEFLDTRKAMSIMNISNDEQKAVFRTISGILRLGNIKVGAAKNSDLAHVIKNEHLDAAAELFSVRAKSLELGLVNPTIKAGNNYVKTHLTKSQAEFSRDALAKAIYGRIFEWIVFKINSCIRDDSVRVASFIGVLDIAGFEIFEKNSFEQICINYTNEKLQQYFNNHMFRLEQEEYSREKIKWDYIDFGLDLQPAIDLIEKPMGILSLLEEQCVFPKATDLTFIEKVADQHTECKKFHRPRFSKNHFILDHYAGEVTYDVTNWLEKNRDPLQEDLISLVQSSRLPYLRNLFAEDFFEKVQLGMSRIVRNTPKVKAKTGAKFQTVSFLYKEQLANLMGSLRSTMPHFIRCILPNLQQKPDVVEAELILNQLRCNGVLEGIRISRKGFPSRVLFDDFWKRYMLLAPDEVRKASNKEDKSKAILKKLGVDPEMYQKGMTKVFLKAGELARLEQWREKKLAEVIVVIQSYSRGYLARKHYKELKLKVEAVKRLQRNVRAWLLLRHWNWFKLMQRTRAMLPMHNVKKELALKAKELEALQSKLNSENKAREDAEQEILALEKDLKRYDKLLDVEKLAALQTQASLEETIGLVEELEMQLNEEEEEKLEALEDNEGLKSTIADLENNSKLLAANLEDIEKQKNSALDEIQEQKRLGDQSTGRLAGEISELNDVLAEREKEIEKLNKARKKVEKDLQQGNSSISSMEQVIATRNGEIDRLKDQVTDLKKELDERSREIDSLRKENKELKAKIEELTADLEDKDKKIKDQKARIKNLEKDLRDLNDNYETLKDDVEELKNSISDKERKEKELSKSLDSESAKLKATESKNAELARQLTSAEESLEDETNKRMKLERMKKDLEENFTNVQLNLEDEASTKEELGGKLKQAEKIIRDMQKDKQDDMKKLEVLDKKVSDMAKSEAHKDGEIESLKTAVKELEKSKKDVKFEAGQLEDEIDSIKSKLKVASASSEKLAEEVKSLKETLDDEQAAHREVHDQAVDLHNKLKDLQDEHDNVLGERSQLQTDKNELKRELDSLHDEMEEEKIRSKRNLDDLSKRMTEGEVSKIREELQEESRLRGIAERENKGLDKKLQQLEQKYNEASADADSLKVKYDDAKNKLDDAVTRLATAEREASTFERRSKALQAELSAANENLGGVTDSRFEAETKLRKSENEVAELRENLEAAEDERNSLSDKFGDLETRSKDLEATNAELSESLKKAEKRLATLESENDDLNRMTETERENARQSTANTKRRLEEEISRLKDKVDSENSQRTSFEKKNRKLDTELQEAKRGLNEENRKRLNLEVLNKRLDEESTELKDQIAEMSKKSKAANDARREKEKELAALAASMDDLTAERKRSDERIGNLESSIREAESLVEEERDRANTLMATLKNAEAERDDYERKAKLLEGKLGAEAGQSQRLKQQTRELATQMERVKEEMRQASRREQDTAAKSEVDDLKAKNDKLAREKENLLENVRKGERSLKDAQLATEKYRKRLADASEENARNRKLLDDWSNDEGSKDGVIVDLESRMKDLEMNLDSARSENETTAAELKRVEARYETVRDELDDAKATIDTLEGENKSLQSEMGYVQEEYGTLKESSKEVNRLRLQLKSFKKEVQTTRKVVDAERRKRQSIESEKRVVDEKLSQLRTQLSDAEATSRRIQKEKARNEAEVKNLKMQLEISKKPVAREEVVEAKPAEDVGKYKLALRKYKKAFENKKAELEELKMSNSETASQIERLKKANLTDVEELNETVNELQEKLMAAERKSLEMSTLTTTIKSKYDTAASKATRGDKLLKQAQRDAETWRRKASEVEASTARLQLQLKKLGEERAEAVKRAEDSQKTLREAETRRRQSEREKRDAVTKLELITTRVGKLEEDLSSKDIELLTLRRSNTTMPGRYSDSLDDVSADVDVDAEDLGAPPEDDDWTDDEEIEDPVE